MTSGMLDIQSLPSLERFDSQLLELFGQGRNDAGGAALQLMDEVQAPDDDLALHRLMSIKANQQKAAAAAAAAVQQQQQQQQDDVHVLLPNDTVGPTSSSECHGAATPFAQPQSPTNPQQHAEHTTPTAAAAAAAAEAAAAEYAAAGHGYATHAAPALPYGISPQLLHLAATNPFAAALAGSRAPPHHQHQPEPPFDTGSGATDIEAYARTLAGMAGMGAMGMADVAGMGGSGSDSGVGFKRRSRGAAMPDLIKLEQDYMDCESLGPAKRGKGQRGDAYALSGLDSDEEDRAAGLSITADMDDATRARIRREKNRVAARKCRAKKMQFMVELQKTLRELMRKNEEYRLQVITWHKMFSREVRLREAMKRIIAVMWQSGVPPAASGYTANDVIIGLESGTLDVNGLLHTLAVLSAHRHLHAQDSTTPTAAAAAVAAAAGVGTGKGGMGPSGLNLAAASPFAADSPTAGVGAGLSVPATPQGQPGSPTAAQLQLQHSDGTTQTAGTDVGVLTGGTAGGAVGGTGADLAGIPGSTAGGAVSSSAPLSGEYETTVLPQSLRGAAQTSHLASTPVAAADSTPAAVAQADAAPATAAAAAVETDAVVAVAARRNTSAHLEEVLAAAGFGDLQKLDSLVVPGLPDMRTQSSGLRALPSGMWAWGA